MKTILNKFLKSDLKINIVVTLVFLILIGLAFLEVLKLNQVHRLLALTILIAFSLPFISFVKNKFIYVNAQKVLLFSINGLFILVIYLALTFACFYIILDGLV